MAKLRKEQAGAASGGFTWATDGAVVDVPDELAAELLAIPGNDFSLAPGRHEAVAEPAVADKADEPEAKAPARRRHARTDDAGE